MSRLFGIFLLHLFLYTLVYNTYLWVKYELNKDEITELFCENTDKPEMNCHGVCHLKKQIIDTQTPIPPAENNWVYVSELQPFKGSDESIVPSPFLEKVTHFTLLTLSISTPLEIDFFHPPQV